VTTAPRRNARRTTGPADAATLGAEGNERLTAWTGAALLIGLAGEGLTILLGVGGYLTWHMVIGFGLLVPVGLKIASTVYRFARYYTNSPAYVRKGPPRPLLRILGPFLVLNTLFVLLSGIAIMFAGGYRHQLGELHKLSFFSWFALTTIHLLAYVWRVPGLMLADLLGRGTSPGDAVRRILLVGGSGLAGIAVAAAVLPWVRSWVAG
jgi:hypothetical protein